MGNDFDKKQPQGEQEQSGQGQNRQDDPNQSSNNPQDTGRKNPNTQEFPERKDREGSEDVEKRRAS